MNIDATKEEKKILYIFIEKYRIAYKKYIDSHEFDMQGNVIYYSKGMKGAYTKAFKKLSDYLQKLGIHKHNIGNIISKIPS